MQRTTWFRPSPWARWALGEVDTAAIEARAEALGAIVTASGKPHVGPWTAYATSYPGGGIREAIYGARGPLAVTLAVLLDNFARQRDMVAEELDDLFTPEEIVQIAIQSGLVAG